MPLKRLWTVVPVLGALALTASLALADNTTAATAIFLPADGTTMGGYVFATGGSPAERWYLARLVGGHSYSIEVAADNNSSTRSVYVDTVIFGNDATSSPLGTVTTTDNSRSPYAYGQSSTLNASFAGGHRVTYIPAAAANAQEVIFIRVKDCCAYLTSGSYSYFRISILDTTQFATWFFTNAQYEAFTQIQNTSNATVTGTLTHYAKVAITSGVTTVCGSPVNFSIPPFSSTFIQASANAGCTSGGGGAKITHNGPQGAIHANVTSVNVVGTGLTHSFNILYKPIVETPAVTGQGY